MALPVDRAQSNAMNLQVLKRQDESVVDIVDMASHVVVYEFDQTLQSWKRKDVEGCLFVVKRYASPRFQIFVNNRLSTTNMTIPVDNRLEVDSVDTFLILRSPDATAAGGYAIYGLWFFPEEDREKILKLLQRMVRSVNEPSAPETPTAAKPGNPKSVADEEPQQQPEPEVTLTQPPVVVAASSSSDGTQPAPKQPRQPRQRAQNAGQRGGRGRNKRDGNAATTTSKPTTPTTILQRPSGDALADGVRDQLSVQEPQTAVAPVHANGNAATYTPISREEGIAAGNAILGMLGGHAPMATQHSQPRSRTSSGNASNGQPAAVVSKEQLKQTLIALLDEPQFFDQIYHAYVGRTHARS